MEYQMQNSAGDLLAQLNNLPSPSAVDPHSTMKSENTLSNPFESEKNSVETSSSTNAPDDTLKSIMSMYPGSEPKPQEQPISWRPPQNSYPSMDSWPTYQVSPKPEPKATASPVTSPIQPRTDTDTKSETQPQTTPSYTAPQYSYTSPKTEPRTEQTSTYPTSSYQSPSTTTAPSYSTPSTYSTSYQQPPTTNYQTASANHVVQYRPSYDQNSYSNYPSSAQLPQTVSQSPQISTNVPQSPQALLNQIEKLQQQNAQQQQTLQQHFSQQIQMQKQLSAIQQTESVTKEFVDKMQASFTKIMGFMESVDQRLSNLEKVTQSILHNQNNPVTPPPPQTTSTATTTSSMMPHPPSMFPSYAVPLSNTSSSSMAYGSYPTLQTADEADAIRKIEQFEEDQKLAKRLQEELELEVKRTPSSSKSTSSTTAAAKKPTTTTSKKDDESAICPICSTQISLAEIETHADKCLESSATTKKDSNGQPTAQEKAGFFAKLFGSKDTPTPTPTPTPVATKPTTTTTAPTTATATRPTTTTATTTPTVTHMPTTMPTAFQPGPSNPNGQQFYQVPYPMYNTAFAPYGYSQYPPPGANTQQGYYYYPGQQPTGQPPKKN